MYIHVVFEIRSRHIEVVKSGNDSFTAKRSATGVDGFKKGGPVSLQARHVKDSTLIH